LSRIRETRNIAKNAFLLVSIPFLCHIFWLKIDGENIEKRELLVK